MLPSIRSLSVLVAVLCLLRTVNAQVSANAAWLRPAASSGDFAEQYINGDTITLSWQAMNNSHSDLWITAYDPTTNGYAKFVKGRCFGETAELSLTSSQAA